MRTYQRHLPHLPDPALPQLPPAHMAEHEPASGLSLLQLAMIARHYWKQSAIIAGTLVLVMAVYIKLMPKTYTATATLIVNSTRESPVAGQQNWGDLASYVATQMELLASPVVLLPVVDSLMLTHDPEFTGGLNGLGAEELREVAARNLSGSVEIDQGRGGQLIYISVSNGDPVKAANIANAIASVYLAQDRRRANDPVTEQAQLSSQELAELRAKVTAAQDQVTAFRQRYGLTNLTANNDDTEMQALTSLESRLLAVQNEQRNLEAQQQGQAGTGDEALASGRVSALRQELATLQAHLAQLRPTLGPRHPEVVGLIAQINATQASLRAALENLSSNISTQLSRNQQLVTQLTQAVATQRAKVLKLRQIQDEGSKLQLELESAQSVYKQALDGFDQVKFATVQNFANVSLVSRAAPPLRPSKPKKTQLLGMACLISLGIGLAIPFLYEMYVDRRVRSRDDIERGLGIRVLAQLNPVDSSEVA